MWRFPLCHKQICVQKQRCCTMGWVGTTGSFDPKNSVSTTQKLVLLPLLEGVRQVKNDVLYVRPKLTYCFSLDNSVLRIIYGTERRLRVSGLSKKVRPFYFSKQTRFWSVQRWGEGKMRRWGWRTDPEGGTGSVSQ